MYLENRASSLLTPVNEADTNIIWISNLGKKEILTWGVEPTNVTDKLLDLPEDITTILAITKMSSKEALITQYISILNKSTTKSDRL